jgi:hypothetical protein
MTLARVRYTFKVKGEREREREKMERKDDQNFVLGWT